MADYQNTNDHAIANDPNGASQFAPMLRTSAYIMFAIAALLAIATVAIVAYGIANS